MAAAAVSTTPALHEDLSDEMALIGYNDFVFSSTASRGAAPENSIYYAPVDKLLSGRLGAKLEADAVDRNAVTNQFTNRAKIPGVVQEKVEDYGVTDRLNKVENPAGLANPLGEARHRAMLRWKEGIELTYLSQQEQQQENGTAPYLTRGASMWASAAAQPNSTLVVPSTYRPASSQNVSVANVAAVKETTVRDLLQEMREARRAKVNVTAFCTLDFGTRFDTFFTDQEQSSTSLPVRRFNHEGNVGEISIGVTSYRTRMGRVVLVESEHLNATRNAGSITSAATTDTSTTVTCASTSGLQPYMKVAGTGIPAGAYIVSITNSTTFVINAAATATNTGLTLTIGEFDHALFLDMETFVTKMNGGIDNVEFENIGDGQKGFVKGFTSLFCSMPAYNSRIYSA